MDKDTIFTKVKDIMVCDFALNPDSVSLNTLLADELELDSLDMVDLILSINDQHLVNAKIDPALFKKARTVQDLVTALEPFWK